MRKCPKCHKWELDVFPLLDTTEIEEDYYFRCWNCNFWCGKKEAEENDYPSEAMFTTHLGGGVFHIRSQKTMKCDKCKKNKRTLFYNKNMNTALCINCKKEIKNGTKIK